MTRMQSTRRTTSPTRTAGNVQASRVEADCCSSFMPTARPRIRIISAREADRQEQDRRFRQTRP